MDTGEKLFKDCNLADVRKKFGTFMVKELQVGHDIIYGDDEKIIICTLSNGVRDNPLEAFLDFAITIDQTTLLRECLDDILSKISKRGY